MNVFEVQTPIRTLYVIDDLNGLFRVADRRGVAQTILTRHADPITHRYSVPATKLSLSVAMEVAEDLAYEDYQGEESARLERLADPLGTFL